MKKLTLLFAFLLTFSSTQLLTAQTDQVAYASTSQKTMTTGQKSTTDDPRKVTVLTNFKATKQQKKVITKINRYVTPRILGRAKYTAGLAGKTVKAQINFDATGAIETITIVEGMGEKIDAKVAKLIRDYDQKQSIGKSVGNATAIQLNVPLVGKKYFVN